MGLTEEEFGQTFCAVCKNRECTRADWAFSSWDKRILGQSERLLNPNIVLQSQASKWEGISDIETLEYSGVEEIWDFSSKKEATPTNFKEVEITTPTPTPMDTKQQPQEIKSETTSTSTSIPMDTKHPTPKNFFNTPAKEIVVGGNVDNKKQKDPWSIPSSNQISVGGVFKMGGKK